MAKATKSTKVSSKKAAIKKTKAIPVVPMEHAAENAGGCEQVFNAIRIARLRIYDGGRVFAYKAPGHNVDYIGYTTDANTIQALFMARNSGRLVTGYTAANCRIGWLDY